MTAFCPSEPDETNVFVLDPIDWKFHQIFETEGIEQAAKWMATIVGGPADGAEYHDDVLAELHKFAEQRKAELERWAELGDPGFGFPPRSRATSRAAPRSASRPRPPRPRA